MSIRKVKCILLIDDDDDCNFFHQRLIKKMDCAEQVYIARDGQEALTYLSTQLDGKYPSPEIIFLDINMPRVNGWEFLERYKQLDETMKGSMVLIMLTTSLNPDDKENALRHPEVSGFYNKYLEKQSLETILLNHFGLPSPGDNS